MPMAISTDHGKDLPTVQLLIKKNQVWCQAGEGLGGWSLLTPLSGRGAPYLTQG